MGCLAVSGCWASGLGLLSGFGVYLWIKDCGLASWIEVLGLGFCVYLVRGCDVEELVEVLH